MEVFSVQTTPNKLPELLPVIWALKAPIQWAPHFFCVQFTPAQSQWLISGEGWGLGCLPITLGIAVWAIHVISCSDEHKVTGTGRLANAAVLKRFENIGALGPLKVKPLS